MKLKGYEGGDTPSVGDKAKVKGKIARTKRRCAPPGTTAADRRGATDIRRVSVSDRDLDASSPNPTWSRWTATLRGAVAGFL